MPFKDKGKQREAWKKAQGKKRKGMTGYDKGMTEPPQNVTPSVTPKTAQEVLRGLAQRPRPSPSEPQPPYDLGPWTMRDGTPGDPRVGPLGRARRNIPIVDDRCVTDHIAEDTDQRRSR